MIDSMEIGTHPKERRLRPSIGQFSLRFQEFKTFRAIPQGRKYYEQNRFGRNPEIVVVRGAVRVCGGTARVYTNFVEASEVRWVCGGPGVYTNCA
ncbi:hypothetical protein EHQ12_03460 [Leptospira gomenensis]|uniref:Uncharacterized protein n=1 Tax=Leptospira gomenensis TaxID=2484974 RepID=A0A5F1Y835_9LEPT|nr:hypothetical protein [Leptospira gomenensis]TGK31116.1 hypothetical protein EHQ17_15495 [Leptospira gomenensis]TGK43320.1 hypothetical protein EHQ12_03460 [Leptospira gomenensis]TGK45165.1 hypothetical protein EHQ07_09505 [Leptospira gomenensis]TGK66079.1 hypothetical protein EHQ13_03240 [Leptospira gomenensis]